MKVYCSWGRIPAEPFVEILREYLGNYETSPITVDGTKGYTGTKPALSPIEILASECGITAHLIRSWLNGKNKTVDFDTADRILCRMDRVHEWRGRLAGIYETVKFEPDHGTRARYQQGCSCPECREANTLSARHHRQVVAA